MSINSSVFSLTLSPPCMLLAWNILINSVITSIL
nr:MAG TPA: hypothetical protein [Caudoviricetes sp.]